MNTTKIKIGEIFEIENTLFIAGTPLTPGESAGENNLIIFSLIEIE